MCGYIDSYEVSDRVTACVGYDTDFNENILREAADDACAVLAIGRHRGEYASYRDFAEFMDDSASEAVDATWDATGDEEMVIAAFEKNMDRRGWNHKRFCLHGGYQSEWLDVVIADGRDVPLLGDADLLETCLFGPIYRFDYFIDGAYAESVGGIFDLLGSEDMRMSAEMYAPSVGERTESAGDLSGTVDAFARACYGAGGIGGDIGLALFDKARVRLLSEIKLAKAI